MTLEWYLLKFVPKNRIITVCNTVREIIQAEEDEKFRVVFEAEMRNIPDFMDQP